MEIIEQNRASLESIEEALKIKYGEALELAGRAKRNQRGAVLAMAGVGELLLMGGELIVKVGWGSVSERESKSEWLARVGVLPDHADKAIFLARNREQLELELWPKDVAKVGLKVCDLLPDMISSNRGDQGLGQGETQGKDKARTEGRQTAQHWLSHTIKLRASLDSLAKDQAIMSWRQDERDSVRLALLPIVRFCESL